MFADARSGKTNTFASLCSFENGKNSRIISGSSAVSACISPSTISPGSSSEQI